MSHPATMQDFECFKKKTCLYRLERQRHVQAAKPQKYELVALNFACCVEVTELLLKAVNTTCGINKTLLTGVEGVAVGTNFSAYLFTHGGVEFGLITAVTAYSCLIKFRMDIFFHDFLLSLLTVKTRPNTPAYENMQALFAQLRNFWCNKLTGPPDSRQAAGTSRQTAAC